MNLDSVWNAIEDARLALEDAQRQLTAEHMNTAPDEWHVKDCGVYIYRDPSVKRSDTNSIVYVGNGKIDRPWQPHRNAIAEDFERDVDIEVLIDGLDGKTAEAIEYYLIKKYNPKYNLVQLEPNITTQVGCHGPWRICAFQQYVQVSETPLRKTHVNNIEALYKSAYGNRYANGGSPFPQLEAGVDYDAVRIRIG